MVNSLWCFIVIELSQQGEGMSTRWHWFLHEQSPSQSFLVAFKIRGLGLWIILG
jgi:hypothetical protein